MNEELYISVIGEIFDGYTEFLFKNQYVYFKHFNIRDQRYIQKYYEKYKNIAINKGLETESSRLEKIKNEEIWTDEDDLKIESLNFEIKNLKQTHKTLFIPSHKEQIKKDIDNKNTEYLLLVNKRKELIGKTAEDYASTRSNEEILRYFLFKDIDLKEHLFTEDEFSELDDLDLIFFIKKQSEISERLSEENIQKAVLRPFFNMYISHCEDINNFYGKPIISLSVYQLKTAIFGRMFYNIFQYTDDIPESIKDDPNKLLSFAEGKRNKNKSEKFIKDDSDASTIFGATKEDMNIITNGSKTVSLKEELKKNGGTLNMEEMIKLAGY